jgi:hypothetical protein
MWGMNRFQRPAWTTGTLIPASFLCGIFSAVFIWRGGQKTKRKQKVEEILRQALEMDDSHRAAGSGTDSSVGKSKEIEKAIAPQIVVDEEVKVPAV